jgi:DNA mismatch repair protein MSH5
MQLSAVGALIDHLVRLNAVGDLENDGIEGLEVRGIEVMEL